MPTDFPTSIDSYTTKLNNVDTIAAADINNLQDATLAIETLLGASSNRATSWTPTVRFATPNTPPTVTSTARYVQFGSLIWISCRIDFSALGTGTGNLEITNLPVAAITTSSIVFALPCAPVFAGAYTTRYPNMARVYDSTILVYGYSLAAGFEAITNAHVGATSALAFSGFYVHA